MDFTKLTNAELVRLHTRTADLWNTLNREGILSKLDGETEFVNNLSELVDALSNEAERRKAQK